VGFVGTRKELVKNYGSFVKQATKGTGIFPGTVFAQMVTESSAFVNGKNLVGASKLTRNSNNFFGIKAYSSWPGEKYLIQTREERPDGTSYYIKSYFRKYRSVEDSIKDYLKLITNARYTNAGVTTAPTVRKQFEALKRGGYFTANAYVDLATNVYNGMKADIDAIPEKTILQPKKLIIALSLIGGLAFLATQPNIKKFIYE
jgi:flagellum-specific peptidoglycan hydrolase FlgJ